MVAVPGDSQHRRNEILLRVVRYVCRKANYSHSTQQYTGHITFIRSEPFPTGSERYGRELGCGTHVEIECNSVDPTNPYGFVQAGIDSGANGRHRIVHQRHVVN